MTRYERRIMARGHKCTLYNSIIVTVLFSVLRSYNVGINHNELSCIDTCAKIKVKQWLRTKTKSINNCTQCQDHRQMMKNTSELRESNAPSRSSSLLIFHFFCSSVTYNVLRLKIEGKTKIFRKNLATQLVRFSFCFIDRKRIWHERKIRNKKTSFLAWLMKNYYNFFCWYLNRFYELFIDANKYIHACMRHV